MAFERKVVLVLVRESQETHVRHQPHDMTLAVKVALNPNTTYQLYQVSSNYSSVVKFDPTPEVKSSTWVFIGKTSEFSLYIAMRPRVSKFCMWFYLVGLYQECPSYSHGGQIRPCHGGHNFYVGLYMENFRNLPVPSLEA